MRRPDPRAWRHALQLTGGDHRRLEVLADGSVTVHNKPLRYAPRSTMAHRDGSRPAPCGQAAPGC